MSIWRRLIRTLDTLSNVDLDEVSAYGAEGEEQAQEVLSKEAYHSFSNRIVPHPQKPGVFLETDAIIYAEGNVFCVEIKRYKGKIYFPPKTKVVGDQEVFDGYDKSRVVKEKKGKYGEGFSVKSMPTLWEETKYYITHLKRFLCGSDARFSRLFIIPVVGFSDTDSDISAIHSMEDGLVYISEIPEFIKHHRNEKLARSPSRWIIDGLALVPTWDRILTRKSEWLNGLVLDEAFTCTGLDGSQYNVSYKDVKSISVSRTGVFSDHDDVKIMRATGEIDTLSCSSYSIKFDKSGERQIHTLRNVKEISIGTHIIRERRC